MRYKLKDIFDLQMGKTPSRNNSEYWNTEDYKWISIADLGKSGKYISETKEYLSESAVTDSGIKVIPANTVVMSFKLSIGKTAITAEDMYSNEAIMAFHDRHVVDILPEYIYYMFKYKNWDEGSNKAVMGKTLNKATLSEVEIDICSMEEQREIVNVLDKMMTVLEGREAELALLDDLIKARFVELFGDPMTNPHNIPKVILGSVLTVEPQNGLYKPQSDYVSDGTGVPILRIDSFYDGKVTGLSSLKRLICSETELKRYLLYENDIVINRVNSIEYLGKCGLIQDLVENTVFESNMMRLHIDENKFHPVYITKLLCSEFIYQQILRRAKKAVNQASINQKDVESFVVYMPPIDQQNQFATFVEQTNKSKVAVQKALDETQVLFDSLMQEYFG